VNEWILAVVVDTNIWISALINTHGAPARLIDAILSGRVRLVVSAPLLAEVHDVVHRNRIRRRISLDDAELSSFLSKMREHATIVPVTGTLRLCRDTKDDMVVETAIAAGADYVVSRDRGSDPRPHAGGCAA
jgi:putative PIN family toxin of toxin-antitoxin system